MRLGTNAQACDLCWIATFKHAVLGWGHGALLPLQVGAPIRNSLSHRDLLSLCAGDEKSCALKQMIASPQIVIGTEPDQFVAWRLLVQLPTIRDRPTLGWRGLASRERAGLP